MCCPAMSSLLYDDVFAINGLNLIDVVFLVNEQLCNAMKYSNEKFTNIMLTMKPIHTCTCIS